MEVGFKKKKTSVFLKPISSSLSLLYYHSLSPDNPVCKAIIDNSLFRTREPDKPYRFPVLKSLDPEFSLWPYWEKNTGTMIERRGVLGRWQSRKHQELTSPPRQQLHWQNLSDITIWQFWSLLKRLQLIGGRD